MNIKHTPEPWKHNKRLGLIENENGEHAIVAMGFGPGAAVSTKIRGFGTSIDRAIACVNGCKNLNPAAYHQCVDKLQDLYDAIDSCIELTPAVLIAARTALEAAKKGV